MKGIVKFGNPFNIPFTPIVIRVQSTELSITAVTFLKKKSYGPLECLTSTKKIVTKADETPAQLYPNNPA